MKILGIGLSHCCGVCLIEDDCIVFAQEEDRFSHRRRHKGWPQQSLQYLFKRYGLSVSDIDLCVLCDLQMEEKLAYRIQARHTVTIHHHLAHIMSGWALSPWSDFDAMSLDGGGDFGSWLSFATFRNRQLLHWESNCGSWLDGRSRFRRRRFFSPSPGKPFGLYWSYPAVLNFGMVDHHGIGGYEGKLMGLAGHGHADSFDPKESNYSGSFGLKKRGDYFYILTEGHPKIGDPRYCISPSGERFSLAEVRRLRKQERRIICEYDLAQPRDRAFAAHFGAFLQRQTDSVLLEAFERNFKPEIPVVVSGGTFSNVIVNGMLNQRYKLFVTPPMGDEGLALGAAAWGAYLSGVRHLQCPGLYLGFDAGSNEQVNPESIAERLTNRQVVGLINGRMELGPRALGARTILADAQDNDINQTINERLGRVEYMPFAPVILEEQASDILIGWNAQHPSAKHMTLVYPVNPTWRERLKGVVHIDGTVRPQVINEQDNPYYYHILRSYFQKTGIPVLINTSFNAHGEPMLRTKEEGLEALYRGRVDVLVAGNSMTSRNASQHLCSMASCSSPLHP